MSGTPRLSVSACDPAGGVLLHRGGGRFPTASVVKVQITAALLLAAQDAGRPPSRAERVLAGAMIRESDNAAATALWHGIGGARGLEAAGRRLGLAATTGGADGYWGLTRTTAADQLALLSAVYGGASPLHGGSRAWLTALLRSVTPPQRWGVSAAGGVAAAGDGPSCGGGGPATGVKNGWMPRSATGRWTVNSIGRVETAGRTLLIAVLSEGHPDLAAGIAAVEAAACGAAASLLPAAAFSPRAGVRGTG